MSSKIFEVSKDDITYAIMPGNDASVDLEAEGLDNTVFGADFSSELKGIISHSFSANAMFRETAGYEARIRRVGSAVGFTNEATTLIGDWYSIVDRDLSIWDFTAAVTVSDASGAIDAADIAEIDYLQGRVRFVSTFTPDGAVTVSGDYLPSEVFGCFNSIDLTQSSDTIETGCFETVGAANGYQFYKPTLRTVSLDAEGFYRESNDFAQILQSRDRFIIEVDVEGDGEAVARGYYTVASDGFSGGPGGDETESVSFTLAVPEGVKPFSWYLGVNSKIPTGLRWVIESWENKQDINYRYFPEGRTKKGIKGLAVITDCSISVSLDSIGEASVSGQGTGAVEILNV